MGLDGAYSVVMENASGAQLSRQYFDVSFHAQTNPPSKMSQAPVSITVRYHGDAAVIKLLRGDDVIYAAPVSAHVPVVQFEGKQEIRWTGTDADGDDLWYELW